MNHTRNTCQQESAEVEPVISTPQTQPAKSTTRSHLSKLVMRDMVLQPVGVKEAELPLGNLKAKGNNLKCKSDNIEDQSLPKPVLQTQPPKAKCTKKATPNPQDDQPHPPARRSVCPRTATEGLPEKQKRRTKAEVLADRAKANKEKLRVEEEAKQNEEQMIRMDVEEDINRAETAAQTIRKFADIENDSRSEEFLGYDDVGSGSDTESDEDSADKNPTKQSNQATQQKKQRVKGMGGGDGGRKKGLGGKKTRPTQTVMYASGLRKDWNYQTGQKKARVQISAGGLEDSDIEDVNPYTSQSKSPSTQLIVTEEAIANGIQKAKQDLSCQNEMVTLVTNDDKNNFVPPAIAKKAATKVPRAALKVKSNAKTQACRVAADEDDHLSQLPVKAAPKRRRLNGNNVRLADLPKFASQKWRNTFLPTLYDKFFTSDEPFDAFNTGNDQFVALLQVIVGEVYPDVRYTVAATDAIHFLAYNRINEKQSLIGSSTLKLIQDHLKTLKDSQAQRDWLRWARRTDGPLFFKDPSPQGSPLKQSNPEYQFPSGRMLSPFILDLAKPFLALSKESVSKNGFPKMLFALIMAALERAVVHLTKPSTSLSGFSKPHWGSQIGVYYQGCNVVPDDRWEELVGICAGKSLYCQDSDGNCSEAELSLLDNNRALIFGFASPTKARA